MGKPRDLLTALAIRILPTEIRSVIAGRHPGDTGIDWAEFFAPVGGTSAAGATVTAETAMRASAVHACVRVVADTIASLPLKVFRRTDRGSDPATEHPLYSLLHDSPNNYQTSVEWRDQAQVALCLRGNAYAVIERDGAGRVTGIFPISPDKVRVYQDRVSLAVVYDVTWLDNSVTRHTADDVLHLRGMAGEGVVGLSPITLAREAIGLSLTAEEHGARFFSNGARPGCAIEVPPGTKPDQVEKLREEWDKMHRGAFNAWRPALLYGGMKLQTIQMTAEDAQFIETRKFQVAEIARIFRVPLHMVGDLDRATFSNIEQQSIDFVRNCIRPWVVRWEQRMNQVLLTPEERKTYFIAYNLEGLLRGDTAARYAAFAIGRQWGWLSSNDIRETEGLNQIPGGDTYLSPLNMTPVGAAKPEPAKN